MAASDGDTWTADVMQETLDKTSLAGAVSGDRVNLERAVTADKRLGGHLVQGHVDGGAGVARERRSEHWDVVEVSCQPSGPVTSSRRAAITVNGVWLTVATWAPAGFTVSLIPGRWR